MLTPKNGRESKLPHLYLIQVIPNPYFDLIWPQDDLSFDSFLSLKHEIVDDWN